MKELASSRTILFATDGSEYAELCPARAARLFPGHHKL
jgi:hypothetical protein